MNERETPETLEVWKETLLTGGSFHEKPFEKCCELERQRDELRELYALDVATAKAERDEARAALLVRRSRTCDTCGAVMLSGCDHAGSCRHYATEQAVMQ